MIFKNSEIPEETANNINTLIARGRVPHTVILSGAGQALREKSSKELCAAVLCRANPESTRPCGKCPDCIKVKSGSHPDITLVTPDKDRKTLTKSRVTELVSDTLYVSPNEAENKIYVFPDADTLSPIIQNMLLKTIEEPPPFVMFQFLCEQRENLLPTVISRSAELPLGDVLSSKSRKSDEQASETAAALADALCTGTEYDLFMRTAPMLKNRLLMKKTAAKLTEIVRDAAIEESGAPLLSGEQKQACALERSFSFGSLMKIKSVLDTIISDTDRNANENLLISRFSSLLAPVLAERNK